MPTLALPPAAVAGVMPRSFLRQDSTPARDEGRLLFEAAGRAFEAWNGHSDFLARQFAPAGSAAMSDPGDPLDVPLGYATFPVERSGTATFVYAGPLQPMPIPDLED
jgi:hypothetical protein